MKKATLIQVYVSDGAALYVNGRLASDWFTVGHADVLRAVGYKQWPSRRACERFYRDNDFPKLLKDVVLHENLS